MSYELKAKCDHCNTIIDRDIDFTTIFFMKVCPHCGEPNTFSHVSARQISASLFRPSTWFIPNWEEKVTKR